MFQIHLFVCLTVVLFFFFLGFLLAGTLCVLLQEGNFGGCKVTLFSLYFVHHAQEVSTPQQAEVVFAVVGCQQPAGELDDFGGRIAAADAAVAVEIGADAYVFDAHDTHQVLDMGNGIEDTGFAFLPQEATVQADLGYAAAGSQGTQLVVSKIARMVAQGAGRRVGGYDGVAADFQGFVETAFAGMRNIDQHAYAVHLVDDLFAEGTHAQSFFVVAGRTAHVVVAVVAEGEVDYPTTAEAFHVGEVLAQCIAVLDAQHQGFPAFCL